MTIKPHDIVMPKMVSKVKYVIFDTIIKGDENA